MSNTDVAPGGADSAPAPVVVTTPAETNAPTTASEAARALSKRRWEKQKEQQVAPAEAPQPEPVEPEQLADEADAAQPETVDPGDKTDAPEPAGEPPIEPPRSWTKEAKDRWDALPREAQEEVARIEQSREREFRRSQNEAAEKLKGLTAKEQQAEVLRQQYEAAIPALLQTLQTAQSGEFSDIKTQEDVNKLASEDWPRFARWQAHKMQVDAVEQEMRKSQERQASVFKEKWSEFAAKEDQAILDKVPELADKTKSQKIADGAVSVLKDIGFSERELASAWNGESSVSLRDHRIQLLILDAIKYREGQANAKKVIAKPLPTVQRPGVAAPRRDDANIVALSKKLETSGSIEDAAAHRAAIRAARR